MLEHCIGVCGNGDSFVDTLMVAINELLYVRKVHEQQYFTLECANGVNYHFAALKHTQDYQSKIRAQLQQWVKEYKADSMTLTLISIRDKKPKETWLFKFIYSEVSAQAQTEDTIAAIQKEAAVATFNEKLVYDIAVTLTGPAQAEQWVPCE